ncbi:DUF5677 domain-containing protein [Nocardioides bizhenqiangii]|uniref:DUF5677 domain-containing protein n=1 Tax=Nocardioides bizhenqiangii TaxID=3095076 RepID=UPI0034DAC653
MSVRFGALCSTRWRANRRRGHTIDVLIELHGQAMTAADDVGALLREGRFVGAAVRWRTLNEVSVIMRFLANASDHAARVYKALHLAEQWALLNDYERYSDALTGRPAASPAGVSASDISRARERLRAPYDAALSRYGPAIGKRYGWAQGDLNRRRVTFDDLVGEAIGYGAPSGWTMSKRRNTCTP